MLLNFIRIILLVILILVIVLDFTVPKKAKDPIVQFIIAFFVLIIVLIEPYSGLIIALILFVIYYKYYIDLLLGDTIIGNDKNKEQFKSCGEPYINEAFLQSAQNNIFDENNIKINTLNQEDKKLYSTQGENNNLAISAFNPKYLYENKSLDDFFN